MKTDWSLIKTAFVTSNKTLVEIAADFKQNLDVVRRHAANIQRLLNGKESRLWGAPKEPENV